MSEPTDRCCAVHTLRACNAQQQAPDTQQATQQARNIAPGSPSILDLARNITRNSDATRAEKLRNKRPENGPDLLRVVAPVVCADCRHFTPDSINPSDGIGSCNAGQDGLHYPRMKRECTGFQITRAALDQLASEISSEPARFAAGVWTDGDYDRPEHIRRLAKEIEQCGIPAQWRTAP